MQAQSVVGSCISCCNARHDHLPPPPPPFSLSASSHPYCTIHRRGAKQPRPPPCFPGPPPEYGSLPGSREQWRRHRYEGFWGRDGVDAAREGEEVMMMMMLGFERESACCVGPVCCKQYGDSGCGRDGGREGVSIPATRARTSTPKNDANPSSTHPPHSLHITHSPLLPAPPPPSLPPPSAFLLLPSSRRPHQKIVRPSLLPLLMLLLRMPPPSLPPSTPAWTP